jgi:putative transcriptional regulator
MTQKPVKSPQLRKCYTGLLAFWRPRPYHGLSRPVERPHSTSPINPKEDNPMFGDTVKTLRKQRGFSQEELASRLHVVRQTVSRWEKNLSVPDAETLTRLAEVLEVPVAQLLGSPSSETSPTEGTEAVVEQLVRINEQLVIRNRRSRRIWQVVAILLGVFALLTVLKIAAFVLFTADTHSDTVIVSTTEEEETE